MTTPTPSIPRKAITADWQNPVETGLYSAGSLVDHSDPSRLDSGIEVEQVNCGEVDSGNPVCGADVADRTENRPNFIVFNSVSVSATYECFTVGTSQRAMLDRAAQLLRLKESIEVERHAAAAMVASDDTDIEVPSYVDAVATLEERLALMGTVGVIHAPASMAAHLASAQLIARGPAGTLLSPLGHRYAFGAGYLELGQSMVATGPVTVHRSEPVYSVATGVQRNKVTATAERVIVPSWECGQMRVKL